MRQKDNFFDDIEKVKDLMLLSKNEFLQKYNISKESYANTVNRILSLVNSRIEINKKQQKKRNDNIEQARKQQLEYYHKNRDKINARRNYLNQIKSAENKKYNNKYNRKLSKREEKNIILEYIQLHKEEIEGLKALWQYEKKLLYQTNYYFTKTKNKRQEAKLNGK